MLRQLISKWGIMSIDLQNAIDKDMAVIQEDGSADYVDNDSDQVVADQELNEVVEPDQQQVTEVKTSDIESEFFNN